MDELKDMGLEYRESDSPDRKTIDFSITDGHDNVCWVWGDTIDDVEVECDHPEIEYDDDETVGECTLCGATCEWHYENNYDDGYKVSDKVPHTWHKPEKTSKLINKIIKENMKINVNYKPEVEQIKVKMEKRNGSK